ncbi:unnamed protein product [Porites evermanni]|uniref:Uncharacterized protein n=1 Tax=Porites evermanni TaxID=104178 RepID=A0ABN8R8E7_9CNID|nr:unnamed protein product [Porites evermanni]
MALQLWQWSCGRNIWLSACHLPGTSNKVADGGSRNFDGSTEWPFNMRVFEDSSPGYNPPPVILQAYPDDKSPCAFTCLKEYQADTTPQRNRKEVIYYLHQATQSYLLSFAGIDTASFKRQRQVCCHL